MNNNEQFEMTLEDTVYQVEIEGQTVTVNGRSFATTVEDDTVHIDGAQYKIELEDQQATCNGIVYPFQVQRLGEEDTSPQTTEATVGQGVVAAMMPGQIVRVLVKEGDQVVEGDVVCVLEAMKMENELQSPTSGEVKAIHISPGDDVVMNETLVEIE